MRLRALHDGHALRHRVRMKLICWVARFPIPDIIRTFLYRPRFFGRPFLAFVHSTLRSRSRWTVGERELFAAFVSKLNQCVF